MKATLFKQGYKTLLVLLTGLLAMSSWGQYSGSGTFTKITSVTELTDGYYVIMNSGDSFAMNNTYNGTFFANTAITPSAGEITNPNTSIVWKIETNGTGRSIYNEQTTKYVSYTGSSNNVQAVDAVVSNNQRWTITYGSNAFTVKNMAVTTRMLQYNLGAPRFACYLSASNQQNLQLYKLGETPHTVTFAPNGGLGTMTPQAASEATDLTLNTFTRTGYAFGGWNTAANGSGTAYTDGQEYDFSADLTLYAQWKPTITYDANGGINPPPAAVTALDGSHTISVPALMSRDNYDFAHWNTQADGNGTTYTPGATATFTTPTTLYAQWLLCAATVQSISPTSGAPAGTEITIIVTADYFNEGVQYDLLFNGSTTPVQATATSDTTIKVTVPTDAKSGTLSISTEQGCPTLTTYTIITNDINGCD